MSVLYCDISTCSPFFYIVWFLCRMIHGWALFVSQRRTGWCPPARPAGSAPELRPEERIKRTSSSGPATDCEIQVNPGRYCYALHCRYVVMRSTVTVVWEFSRSPLPTCLPTGSTVRNRRPRRLHDCFTWLAQRWHLLSTGYLDCLKKIKGSNKSVDNPDERAVI